MKPPKPLQPRKTRGRAPGSAALSAGSWVPVPAVPAGGAGAAHLGCRGSALAGVGAAHLGCRGSARPGATLGHAICPICRGA